MGRESGLNVGASVVTGSSRLKVPETVYLPLQNEDKTLE